MSLPAIDVDTDLHFSPFSLPSFHDGVQASPSRPASRRISARNSRAVDPGRQGPQSMEEDMTSPQSIESEKISSLDPRRLTPTLHATLVSEILNLRHEVQNKNKELLGLEENLSTSREENVRLNDQVAQHVRDAKGMKQQMKMLEGGTMSALDEMAVDRDRAMEQISDLKKRLEASQARAKQQADEVNRTTALWERDQENWSLERRALDHKMAVVDGRLKTMAREFEALQAQRNRAAEVPQRTLSRQSRASGRDSAASNRRDSSASPDGGNRSRLSHISEIDRPAHVDTLADELAINDDEDVVEPTQEPYSPEALPEEHQGRPRPFSMQSHRQSIKAYKLLGLAIDSMDENGDQSNHHEPHDERRGNDLSFQYGGNTSQGSPPLTPRPSDGHILDTITEASSVYSLEGTNDDQLDYDTATSKQTDAAKSSNLPIMVSSAAQTVEQPLSPPHTPPGTGHSESRKAETCSIGTQTEEPETKQLSRAETGSQLLGVPTIAIHRPTSSYSDRSVVLPPQTKSVSCQAAVPPLPMRSTGMQTEEIRIDKRPIKLPPHLLPSAVSSKPSSPVPEKPKTKKADQAAEKSKARTASPVSSRIGKRASRDSKRDSSSQAAPTLSTIEGYVSDDSFIAREPVKKVLSKAQDKWQHVPAPLDDESSKQPGTAWILGTTSRGERSGAEPRKGKLMNKAGKNLHINTDKADTIRRSALVASGSAAHIQRARSPSLPTLPSSDIRGVEPPFPVPDRSSSRKFPWEGSEGTESPTLQTISFFGGDKETRRHHRPPVKRGLRKTRSENADTSGYADVFGHMRKRSRSPPPTSNSSFTEAESPGIHVPPLPNDDIQSPFRIPPMPVHQRQTSNTHSAADSAATNDSIHVVDAIAQTMIGEWMWKYTRRRKAFGLTSGDDFDARGREGDSLRHQRWVWLAPSDRAVLWSTKQPASSVALQGKLGHRKLEIQSVLDVRDDAPMPRGADPSSCFGRSILILTPQRALKFTAMTRERHYLWLSALSFLSQPGSVPEELGGVPPVPSLDNFAAPPPPSRGQLERKKQQKDYAQVQPKPQSKPATAFLRRHPVRDSIRVAKGKERPKFPNGGRRANTDGSLPTLPPPLVPTEAPAEESDVGCDPPHVPRRVVRIPGASKTSSSFRSLGSGASSKPSTSRTALSGFESDGGRYKGTAEAPSAGYSSRYNSLARGSTGPASPVGSGFEEPPPLPRLATQTSAASSIISGPLSADALGTGTMRMDAFVNDGGYAPKPSARAMRTGGGGKFWQEPLSAGVVESGMSSMVGMGGMGATWERGMRARRQDVRGGGGGGGADPFVGF